MRVLNQAEWDDLVARNSKDAYGACTVRYAQAWAELMEQRMPAEPTMKDFVEHASKASHDADTEGITGFMYGYTVGALAKYWVHGELLRRWHNKDTQIGTEGDEANENGGVLNPAVLVIGSK